MSWTAIDQQAPLSAKDSSNLKSSELCLGARSALEWEVLSALSDPILCTKDFFFACDPLLIPGRRNSSFARHPPERGQSAELVEAGKDSDILLSDTSEAWISAMRGA